jgi:citrate lyase subunit beta/citryl-CoA lyase
MRSLLLVPADSPRQLADALASGADVLIVDLEDSVAAGAKQAARAAARDFLAAAAGTPGGPRLFVRINALDSGLADADLDAVMAAAPQAIVLPKATAGADVQHLGVKLAVREAENGLADGATRILAIATETAASIFTMRSYAGASRRLLGLAWGAEDLAVELGAAASRLDDGTYAPPCLLARTLTLVAAAAAGVAAIDAIAPKFDDLAGLHGECEAARRDGFTAKLAIHPRQVPVINESFTPSPAAIAHACAIIAAFAADPGAGSISLGGEMLDRPHLKRAERTLARVASLNGWAGGAG